MGGRAIPQFMIENEKIYPLEEPGASSVLAAGGGAARAGRADYAQFSLFAHYLLYDSKKIMINYTLCC